MERIIIKNAYQNNLKHIDLEIPLNAFICVTGCSGGGKSSLVFDTIYAESQRGFLEGMTGNIFGKKIMDKPKVGHIENLRPALNISQNYYNVNPRSTVGTITEISYYLRTLFSLVNSNQNNEVPVSVFSSNNPKAFCKHCLGLGTEIKISEALLMPDKDKKLIEGGILFFKGAPESKEQKTLLALCEHYKIDVNKRISDLNERELCCLLYSDEKIKYKLSYKEGKRRKQHFVYLQGAISSIKEKMSEFASESNPGIYSKYSETVPCHVCGGAKLDSASLQYKVNGLNYYEAENMEVEKLAAWMQRFDYREIPVSMKDLSQQLVEVIYVKSDALIKLNLGYLSLNRTIPSLSGGERQRVRIATQLTCSLKGLMYILDEPCKGLHHNDINNIISATHELVDKGNTVIAIEHNKQYISEADNVIELGPEGGPEGGYLLISDKDSVNQCFDISFKALNPLENYFELHKINFRNINEQTVRIPLKGITCITGVSGSGKSTLTSVIYESFKRKIPVHCEVFKDGESIKRVIAVDQVPIGKTPRSTVVSYLEIYDEIRKLFAGTNEAKTLKLNATSFSMNVKGGRCECCQGTGFQKMELNYLPSSYILCPECNGKRFKEDVLMVKYKGKNIQEVLDTPIVEIVDIFKGSNKVFSALNCMMELGLGYLKLGQMSMNLSGGEAQRIKLAKALSVSSKGHNLYILDEPTSGLNDVDIKKVENILFSLQNNGETIIVVEHNVEFISHVSDYIVDFGIVGGSAGGEIVSQGAPKEVFKDVKSSLYGLDMQI